jgi:hypothetical protein
MRFVAFGMGLAVVLAAASAWAAGGVGGKGDIGGKGGPGPENSLQSGAAGTQETPPEVDTSLQAFGGKSTANADTTQRTKILEQKPWEVSATYELHRLIRQEDLGGAGVSKVFDLLYLSGRYSLGEHDRIIVSAGVTQNFLADAAESGFRATDISVAYSHGFDLPYELKLTTTGGLTVPISFYSQLATNITTPSLTVSLSRKFGDLALQATLRGLYFWDKYTSACEIGAGTGDGCGQPNVKWSAGGSLSAEYDMPFYRPLSAGLALTDSYLWFYNVGQPPYNSSFYGATQDPQFSGQPMQQSYGGEIFVRYVMPDLSGVKSDITLALANGDPSLGYPSVLHDGIVHPYLLYRDTAEVYFALEGRY